MISSKDFMAQQPSVDANLDAVKTDILVQSRDIDNLITYLSLGSGSYSDLEERCNALDKSISRLEEYYDVPKINYLPQHYAGKSMDVIEFCRVTFSIEQFCAMMLFNIIKYTVRLGRKDSEAQEIKKIRTYFIRLKEAIDKGTIEL